MQKLLTAFVLAEGGKVLLGVKFHKMYFIRFTNLLLNIGIIGRAYSEQKLSIILADEWNGYVFKLMKHVFLTFFDVNQLR